MLIRKYFLTKFQLKKKINSLSLGHCVTIFLFISIVVVRLYHLGADPPMNLSWSGGLFGDETGYAHNARNKILFGQWITDGFNPVIYSPFLTLIEYLFFSVLGVGLIQLRLVNVTLIVLGLILLFSVLKKSERQRIALITILLLGFNYIFIMYSRLGLNDVFLIFPLILTLYLWQKGLNKYPILFLAGISSFVCYITKASALYFICVTLTSLLFAVFQKYKNEEGDIKSVIVPLAYFMSGLGISFVCWYIFFFSPNRAAFASISANWFHVAMPSNFTQLWNNLASPYLFKYLSRTPLELIISWVYAPLIIYGLFKNWRNVQPLEIFVFLWLLGGYMVINGLNYHPLRYFISLIPPTCILTAFALDKMWETAFLKKITLNKFSLFWLIYIFWLIIIIKLSIYFIGYNKMLKGLSLLAVSTAILSIIYFVIQKLKLIPNPGQRKSTVQIFCRSAVITLIFLSLSIDGFQYWEWAKSPQYMVKAVSKELGKILDNAYILGLWAPLATIENKHRSLYVGEKWFNYRDTFNRYPVTHLFLWDGNHRQELRFLQKAYPEVMKKVELLKTYTIKEYPVRLYKIKE